MYVFDVCCAHGFISHPSDDLKQIQFTVSSKHLKEATKYHVDRIMTIKSNLVLVPCLLSDVHSPYCTELSIMHCSIKKRPMGDSLSEKTTCESNS